ncbi:MAG TPA: PDZ domain-containing protein [Planctomycetota bacterium]
MGRVLTAILAVLVLYLAAVNARLHDRIRILERRPAPVAVAKKPAAAPPAVESADVPLPAPPPPAAEVEAPRAAAAVRERRHKILGTSNGGNELSLSEAQKTMVDELKRLGDAEAQVYRDLVRGIEERTERSIRALLTPEQLAKYPGDQVEWTMNVLTAAATEDRPTGYMGVAGEDGAAGGARLSQVFPNTPAATYGLRTGDVILELNGQPLQNYQALADRVRQTSPGEAVLLRVQRDGADFQHTFQLGARPR